MYHLRRCGDRRAQRSWRDLLNVLDAVAKASPFCASRPFSCYRMTNPSASEARGGLAASSFSSFACCCT